MAPHKHEEVVEAVGEGLDTSLVIMQMVGKGAEGLLSEIGSMIGQGIGSHERNASRPRQGIAVAPGLKLVPCHLAFLSQIQDILGCQGQSENGAGERRGCVPQGMEIRDEMKG